MRKKDDALRETLLCYVRTMVASEGVDSVTIRNLAQRAGVSTGTIYNHFKNKDEILLVITQEHWKTLIAQLRTAIRSAAFSEQVREIFFFLQAHMAQGAGALMGSLHHVESDGRARMAALQSNLEAVLLKRLQDDASIRPALWGKDFSQEDFARFVMRNISTLLQSEADDIGFLIELIRRTLY